MVQSDNLSTGIENVSIAPGTVMFVREIVQPTDTTVHTSTRNSVSNAMLFLTPAAYPRI